MNMLSQMFSFKSRLRFVQALVACAFALPMLAQSQIVMREVTATGNGGDISSATIDAIENAIGQVGGMKISTASSLSMSEISKGDNSTFEKTFKQNVERITRGIIKSYKV